MPRVRTYSTFIATSLSVLFVACAPVPVISPQTPSNPLPIKPNNQEMTAPLPGLKAGGFSGFSAEGAKRIAASFTQASFDAYDHDHDGAWNETELESYLKVLPPFLFGDPRVFQIKTTLFSKQAFFDKYRNPNNKITLTELQRLLADILEQKIGFDFVNLKTTDCIESMTVFVGTEGNITIGGIVAFFQQKIGLFLYPEDVSNFNAAFASIIGKKPLAICPQPLPSPTPTPTPLPTPFPLPTPTPKPSVSSPSEALRTHELQKLYVNYFGRPADPNGHAYWMSIIERGLADGREMSEIIQGISEAFSRDEKYRIGFSGLASAKIITRIYQNLFNHAPEQDALVYWSSKLDTGAVTFGQISRVISEGAVSTDAVIFLSKVTAAVAFTQSLDTAEEIIGYSGDLVNNRAKKWLAEINNTSNLAAEIIPQTLDESIQKIIFPTIPLTATPVLGQEFTQILLEFVPLPDIFDYKIYVDDRLLGSLTTQPNDTIASYKAEGLNIGTTFGFKVDAVREGQIITSSNTTGSTYNSTASGGGNFVPGIPAPPSQSQPVVPPLVTTYAGAAAGFNGPQGITRDSAGNLYISDTNNHRIRKIDSSGNVTTIAGSVSGNSDGTGTAALFNGPQGIARDSVGNLYVVDANNQRIRKIDSAGVVTTISGSTSGSGNGTGTAALFQNPKAITLDSSGNLFVTDSSNNRIRKIAVGSSGSFGTDCTVTTLTGSTFGSVDGVASAALFSKSLGGITTNFGSLLYVVDSGNNSIRKVDSAGNVTTLAGGASGTADGFGTNAQFSSPQGIARDNAGNLYVVDNGNNNIRKIDTAGNVTTIVGGPFGSYDGVGTAAAFKFPNGITTDFGSLLFVTDTSNNLIRKISL